MNKYSFLRNLVGRFRNKKTAFAKFGARYTFGNKMGTTSGDPLSPRLYPLYQRLATCVDKALPRSDMCVATPRTCVTSERLSKSGTSELQRVATPRRACNGKQSSHRAPRAAAVTSRRHDVTNRHGSTMVLTHVSATTKNGRRAHPNSTGATSGSRRAWQWLPA